ncbi:hypothetical protein C7212DRAFT_335234 [Tuber magnatum]|uniref:Uncharacterized protein n=1 Tax=Tuber magnatum TaxID=42249 RepID=A0A317SH74_9PEZI|nr:hypothetical protein C7212DRAFT_335234 [Tuber magnatum]
MSSIKLLKSSAPCGRDDKGQELGKHEETAEERHEDEVAESLFADLAKSPFDAHHLDIEAAITLLGLASGHEVHAEISAMVTGSGGAPLSRNTRNAIVNDMDGSRPVWSFASAHMLDPNTIVTTPFEDIEAAVILFSAHLAQYSPLAQKSDPNPMVSSSFEDTQAAVILFSIYLDQARSRHAALG